MNFKLSNFKLSNFKLSNFKLSNFKLNDCLARIAYRHGISKRACLNPADSLYSDARYNFHVF